MALAVYVHVKKENGQLRVIGVQKNTKEDHLWLFDEHDRDISKHSFVAGELKNQSVTNYRNVKVCGASLSMYFDEIKNSFVFNGKTLTEDKEKSFNVGDDGKLLNSSIYFGFVLPLTIKKNHF